MKTPSTPPQRLCRRAKVFRREFVRGGRVTSLVAAEVLASSSPTSPALLAAQMATYYLGTLPSSCAGLVTAFASDGGDSDAASCGFVLHPTAVGRVPLIRLDTPRMNTRPGYARLTYPITGGLLVGTAVDHPGHSGFGTFSFEATVAGTSPPTRCGWTTLPHGSLGAAPLSFAACSTKARSRSCIGRG